MWQTVANWLKAYENGLTAPACEEMSEAATRFRTLISQRLVELMRDAIH